MKEIERDHNPLLDLEAAFNGIGQSMYPDEFACELMAWFHCFGGSNEAVVLNPGLNGAIRACAGKMKIEGGSIPDPRLVGIWRQKVRELADAVRYKQTWPDWIPRICDRYKLALPEKSRDYLEDDWRFWKGVK